MSLNSSNSDWDQSCRLDIRSKKKPPKFLPACIMVLVIYSGDDASAAQFVQEACEVAYVKCKKKNEILRWDQKCINNW